MPEGNIFVLDKSWVTDLDKGVHTTADNVSSLSLLSAPATHSLKFHGWDSYQAGPFTYTRTYTFSTRYHFNDAAIFCACHHIYRSMRAHAKFPFWYMHASWKLWLLVVFLAQRILKGCLFDSSAVFCYAEPERSLRLWPTVGHTNTSFLASF